MNTKIFFGALVLVAGIITGWYVMGDSGQQVYREVATNEKKIISTGAPIATDGALMVADETKKGLSVLYNDDGFSPRTLTVSKGSAVVFTNQSARGMWVASGMHPTHQLLPGFDQLATVAKNGTYTYLFDKVGTWQYHNHVNPTDTAIIVVTEK